MRKTEHRVGHRNDLKPGEMRSVELADGRAVLLVDADGELHAYGATCPHHGAPLADGLIRDGEILRPWHVASFDWQTGRCTEPPSLDNLPRYEVRLDGDEVCVRLPEDAPAATEPAMAARDTASDDRVFVIVGAGAAGATAAETLRKEGFSGRILLLSAESEEPYDRTELSEGFLQQPGSEVSRLRSRSFYEEHGIELLTDHEVVSLDPDERAVSCRDRGDIRYDRALVATGAEPRTLGIDGEELENVTTLRRPEDARRIREAVAEGDPAVVVVASFIGMEVAASLAGRGVRVTVVAPDSVPFERTLGPDVGGMYRELHESNGVTFLLGRAVESFRGDGGRVREAVLDTGDRVPARLAVLGVGVRPATEWLGVVPKADDGGLIVDELLRVEGRSDLFAAGDVASYPDPRDGGRLRIEHWRVAMQQGRTAACNMLGRETPYDAVPFFWTNQYMVITDYLGHAEEWDDALVDGDLEGGEFVVYYVGDGRARAVSCCGDEQAMLRIHHVLSRHPLPAAEELRDA